MTPAERVPAKVLSDRLMRLALAVTEGPEVVRAEFTMRVPAEPERDADLILSEAARRVLALGDAPVERDELRDALLWHWVAQGLVNRIECMPRQADLLEVHNYRRMMWAAEERVRKLLGVADD